MRQALALRRQFVFFFRIHLTKRTVEPVRPEKWIVAKTLVAPWRPYCDAIDAPLEFFCVAIGPGDAERGDEMCASLLGSLGAMFDQQRLNAVHRTAKVLIRPRPAGGMNARLTVERIDDQSGIIGKRGLSTRSGSGQRLDACIRAEGFAGFFRLGQRELRSRL